MIRLTALAFLACAIAWAGDAADLATKDTPWCTLSVPKTAKPGEQVTLTIAIKPGAIAQPATLCVDLHKYVGKERKPGAGRARPMKLNANEPSEHKPALTIPADATAVTFVVYIVPAGKTAWADKLESTELGIKVAP